MKLKDLEAGTLFQFVRNRSPNIYMVILPAQGVYRVVGRYLKSEALPFCGFPECLVHGQATKTEKPTRAVRALKIPTDGPLFKWITKEVDYVSPSMCFSHLDSVGATVH